MNAASRLVVHDEFSIVESRDADGVFRLRLDGELDAATTNTLAERLAYASKRGEATVLDLRELDFMDSSGLRLLLSAQADAARDGWKLWIANPQPAVHRLFEITGAVNRLSMRDS
jgi:stage II sporulation protein AA (anti-sigma F factor antagonist)